MIIHRVDRSASKGKWKIEAFFTTAEEARAWATTMTQYDYNKRTLTSVEASEALQLLNTYIYDA